MDRRIIRIRRLVRSRAFTALMVVALLLPMIAIMGGSAAPLSFFEIEGNLIDNAAPPPPGAADATDWFNTANQPNPVVFGLDGPGDPTQGPGFKIEDTTSQGAGNTDQDYFSPSGKFDAAGTWSITSGSVGPAQNDLTNLTVMPLQALESPNSTSSSFMLMSMERMKKEGTFKLIFEFNRDQWDGSNGTNRGPAREEGDIVVFFELSGNPDSRTEDLFVQILRYDPDNPTCADVTGPPAIDYIGTFGGGFCTVLASNGAVLDPAKAEATMNDVALTVPAAWNSKDTKGNVRTTIGAFEFAEAALNLTGLGIDPGCPGFGSVYAATVSAISPTADLKDLAGPQALPITCGARIQIGDDDVNEVGESHTFTAFVEKNLGTGVFQPAAGEEVDITLTHSDANGDIVIGGTEYTGTATVTCTTDSAGECDVTFHSVTPGAVTGHAEASLLLGNVSTPFVVETDGQGGNSGDATKYFVDATVAIEDDAINGVNDTHTFTITATAYPGGVSGVTFNSVGFTLSDPTKEVSNTCASPSGTGNTRTCTVTVDSSVAATIVANGSTSITFTEGSFSDTVTRTTDGLETELGSGNFNSGPATKHFVDVAIDINPDGVNEVGESHDFTITVTPSMPPGVSVSAITITPSVDPGPDSADDDCDLVTAAGPYTCTLTISDSQVATFTASATADVTFTDGTNSLVVSRDTADSTNGDAVKRFVDATVAVEESDTNGVGEPHTFTITVTAYPDGVSDVSFDEITFELTPDDSTYVSDTCATPSGTGNVRTCTVTVDSDVATDVTINASASVTFTEGTFTDTVERTTDGLETEVGSGNSNSGPATKEWIAGVLAWEKHDQNGNLLGGATFEVCRTHDFDSQAAKDPLADPFVDLVPDACVTVFDNAGLDAAKDDPLTTEIVEGLGEFMLVSLDGVNDLPLGRYTIEETVPPPGYGPDPDPVRTVELTIVDPSNADNPEIFVNTLLLKMFIITCNQATNEVINSEVSGTFPQGNTSPQNTLDPQGPQTVDDLVAQFCALTTGTNVIGAAEFYNLPDDTYETLIDVLKDS
jgi:hypothetical protein